MKRSGREGPLARGEEASSPPDPLALALPVHLVALLLIAATVVLAGQPIYANDTWVHLALGREFAAAGPWLDHDPHLFTAPGPPAPGSWLGSLVVYAFFRVGGFGLLRLAHAMVALALAGLVWHLMRRAGSSRTWASAGVVGFVALSTYRLVQLRPELFTIAATLSLYPVFVESRSGPDGRRLLLAAALGAVWANVHAAFLLGPILLVGSGVAVVVDALVGRRGDETRAGSRRGGRITLAGVAMLAASLLNPMGASAIFAYGASGEGTPELASISDEWNPTNLLAWPIPSLPPTVAAWLLVWACVVAVLVVAIVHARNVLGATRARSPIDPALLALAAAGLVAAASASRFLWLGVFALALVGARASRARSGPPLACAFALAAGLLHVEVGDWPLVSRELTARLDEYDAPFLPDRFDTTPVWFLADSEVEGRIFNDYPLGGFLAFWLAPRVRMSSSGTMNVARDAMDANFAIGSRQILHEGESYSDLLDRQGLDLFLGLGFPIEATTGRPVPCTVRHLEHEPGWMLVFRNLRSAVYLRRNARNAANLDRIAAYYVRAGVPFDRNRGFDVEAVLRAAPDWATAHGLIPTDFARLEAAVEEGLRAGRVDDRARRLAVLDATLGRYEHALALEARIRSLEPADAESVWRTIWTLAQLGRWDDAFAIAARFERDAPPEIAQGPHPWTQILGPVRALDASTRATLVAHLPLFRASELGWVLDGVVAAPPRRDMPRHGA